jgi:Hemerythrin HHE cation binding domain
VARIGEANLWGGVDMRTMTREPMSSSEARAAILSSNEELRGLVQETIHVAEGTTQRSTESAADFEPLRLHARDLYAAFTEHMEFEEKILPTALCDVIGWGPELRAQMEGDHERCRASLAAAMLTLEPDRLSAGRMIEQIRALADTLLVDLDSEERYLLTADLDALANDSEGG